MVSETDIAYLAGLFDGEGSIFTYKQWYETVERNTTIKLVIDCLTL